MDLVEVQALLMEVNLLRSVLQCTLDQLVIINHPHVSLKHPCFYVVCFLGVCSDGQRTVRTLPSLSSMPPDTMGY